MSKLFPTYFIAQSNLPTEQAQIPIATSKQPPYFTLPIMTSEPDLPLVLPPDTTPSEFKTYIKRARQIVSSPNVTVITSDTHPDLTNPTSYLSPAKAHDMYHILSKTHFVAVRFLSQL